MKLTSIRIIEYKNRFLTETILGSLKSNSRSGWYLKIYANELCGIGEASPIPGISLETHQEVGYALNGFKLALEGIDYAIELEELLLLSEVHGFNMPSVQFAIQSAAYDLFSKSKNKTVAKYLNGEALNSININSIYHKNSTISNSETKVLKVKITEKNIFNIRERVDSIIEAYPPTVKLRLDFNGALDLVKAVRVCRELENYNIDYIEQPLPIKSNQDLYDLRMSTDIPIALDESVSDYKSVLEIIKESYADVLIIKPTMTGSFNNIKKIVDLSKDEGLKSIITSSFETSIAQFYIANLIAALKISDYCGVFNVHLFDNDRFPAINKGECLIIDEGIGYPVD